MKLQISHFHRRLGILLCLFPAVWAAAQENGDVDTLRPTVLFEEDFEKYTLGSRPIDDQAPAEAANQDTDVVKVDVRAGDTLLESQQLIVSEGAFEWETEAIPLEEPILTTAAIRLTAIAGPEGFAPGDRVQVYARLDPDQIAPEPLLDISLADQAPANDVTEFTGFLPCGTLSEALWSIDVDNGSGSRGGFAGVLSPPQSLQFALKLESTRPGNHLAIDDIIVRQEPTISILNTNEWNRQAFHNAWFLVIQGSRRDPEMPAMLFQVNYRESGLKVDLSTLNEGELCFGSTNLTEEQRLQPVRNFRSWDTPLGGSSVSFTMDRPENGWRSITRWPGLFLCQGSNSPERIDIHGQTGLWADPPFAVIDPSVSATVESENLSPIQGDEPFVDFTVRINSEAPYQLDALDELSVVGNIGWVTGDTLEAEPLGEVEVLNSGHVVRLGYRLQRPIYGWPTQQFQITISGLGPRVSFGFLPVAPGRSSVKVVIPPSEIVPPGETGPASKHAQFVLPSQETFTIHVDYVSDTPIDLDTIGDGDVVLSGATIQPGRLVSVAPSNGDRMVRATFEFTRDPIAYRYEDFLELDFPNAAVSNLDGGKTIGLDVFKADFANIPVREESIPGLDLIFIPTGSLNPALESYRFRILYKSDGSELNRADFDQPHLILTPETIQPNYFANEEDADVPSADLGSFLVATTTSQQILADGRSLQIDYVVNKPEAGWSPAYRIETLAASLRDVDGRGIKAREIAIVGRNDLKAIDAELIGGALIDGDPDTHRLSFLVQTNARWAALWRESPLLGRDFGTFEDAQPVLGWDQVILPALQEDESTASPVLGRFTGLQRSGYRDPSPSFDFTANKFVLNLEIDRPEGGWDRWASSRVPFVLQAPRLKHVPSSVIASGFLTLADSQKALPLLFSFEEWVKQLERQAELPEGSLERDSDGDGQDGLTEFILGSDLLDNQDTAVITPNIVTEARKLYTQLEFTIRSNSLGVTAEIQRSTDGKTWSAADDDFRVKERTRLDNGLTRLCLISKAPAAEALGLFRIAVAR